jgi:predicted DsbA family dithiol-disulfide isomerase
MQIDVWSDFACPWCALGLYRLDAALTQFDHADAVQVVHRAFELDPHAPPRRPQSMDEVLARKYGMSPAQVDQGHRRLTALGDEVGMPFAFDRIQLGNTFDAHRLARAGRGTAAEGALVKGLFGAYFTDGRLLSDPAVLREVAAAAGLDAELARATIEGDTWSTEVRDDEDEARAREITGVPHFLINGTWAIPGAQDVETIVLVLNRAWARSQVAAT